MTLTQDTLTKLRQLVGAENVLTAKEDLIPYSFDGTAALQQMPGCVAFARTPEQIAGVLKLAVQRVREAQSAGQNLQIAVSGKRGINFLVNFRP